LQGIGGILPTEIGMLTKLSSLALTNNEALTGTIPTEIGRLSVLRYLFLNNTTLSGRIPTADWNANKTDGLCH
jgi:hypothetical protein